MIWRWYIRRASVNTSVGIHIVIQWRVSSEHIERSHRRKAHHPISGRLLLCSKKLEHLLVLLFLLQLLLISSRWYSDTGRVLRWFRLDWVGGGMMTLCVGEGAGKIVPPSNASPVAADRQIDGTGLWMDEYVRTRSGRWWWITILETLLRC